MSNNHPNDNIYSILNKLNSLQSTPEEKHDAVVKQIRESVEAQGSVLEGVGAVEARLTQKFAEAKKSKPDFLDLDKDGNKKEPMKKAAKEKVDEKAINPYAVGMAAAKKKYGYGEEPAHDLPKKVITKGHEIAKKVDVEEATCNECGMYESKCSCNHTNESVDKESLVKAYQELYPKVAYNKKGEHVMEPEDAHDETCYRLGVDPSDMDDLLDEGEVTHPEKGVTRHTKTDFPGYPADDGDDLEGLRGPGAGKRGRPRKHAKKEPTGLGRGRPVKAKAPTYSKHADPFGRVSGAVPKSKVKGRVHSMDESMSKLAQRFSQINEGLNFKRMAEETHQSIDELMSELQHDIREYKISGHCSEKLKDFLTVHSHSKKQMADEAAMAPGGIGHDLITPQQRVAQATPPKPGIMGAVKDVAQGAKNWIQGKPEQGPTYEEQDPLHAELNELARLAGLKTTEGNAFTGKLAKTPKGGEFELDGKKFKDTSSLGNGELDDGDMEEGNEFSGELAQARAQHKDSFEVDGKEYPVKEEKLEVKEPDEDNEPVNKPKPEYKTMRQSTMNPGEGDAGEKEMNPDRPTFKNGDNALAKPSMREAVSTLEARLAAEYESIKKVSK